MGVVGEFLMKAWKHNPAWTYSVIVGFTGPILVLTVPPIRRMAGYKAVNDVPRTYPYPEGKRSRPSGYSDENPKERT